ncbi:MAG TPA: VWA domain-containing protein [Vicinamibacteria bacterium]|nr:VWA domain-containing protein [Vicinamibacteria bacterium]
MRALAAWALLSAAAAPQPPPVFRAEVDLVRVEALVTRRGAPVAGLRAADFELRDNGRVQALDPVLEEESPVDTVLVLDMSYSVRGPKLDALKDAARGFLDGLRDGEQAAVMAFREEVHLLQPFTPDLARARRSLDEASPRGSTALCDAVYAALRLREPGPRRTAVVVFSDGIENMSWLTGSEVLDAASRSEAIVYGVAVPERGQRPEPFLEDVVHATGGRLFPAAGERDLRARFLDVLSDIRARYVLSYAPRGADAAGWHTLDVRLRRVKGDVLARPGYWRYASAP